MEQIIMKAYAKVNLALDVLGRRENGYHDLRMVMQTVDLYDLLTFTPTDEPGVILTSNVSNLPIDGRNLICKAAALIMERYGVQTGVLIHLEKRIPMAAGMAGGSTDAAATLIALNELFRLGLSKDELCALGVQIGADVPYCILGGTALAEGIGEILTPLPRVPACPLVITKPDFGVSTKEVYENLDLNLLEKHPDVDFMIQAIKDGDLKQMASYMRNDLESVTESRYPEIAAIKERMIAAGAFASMMSGSGPTVFCLCENEEIANHVAKEIREAFPKAETKVSSFYNVI